MNRLVAVFFLFFSGLLSAYGDDTREFVFSYDNIHDDSGIYTIGVPADTGRNVLADQGKNYGGIGLTWRHYSDDLKYTIYRSDTEGLIGPMIMTIDATAYPYWLWDISIFDGTAYNTGSPYWASPGRFLVNKYWYTVIFESVNKTYTMSLPQALGWAKPVDYINDLSATKGTSAESITLTWTPIPGASSYTLSRGFVPATIVATTTESHYADTSLTDYPAFAFDLSNGIDRYDSFFYNVQANFPDGSSTGSNMDWGYLKPLVDPITDLSATSIAGAVRLAWTANPDATSYEIYKAGYCSAWGDNCQWTMLATVPGGKAAYDDSTLYLGDPSYAYPYYYVIAKIGDAASPESNRVLGWPGPSDPTVISDLSASQGNIYGAVNLAWTASPDATGYDVYRADSATGVPAKLNDSPLAAPSFIDLVGDGAHHFYTVVIATADGASNPPSNQAEGWSKIPGGVDGLSASQGTAYGAVSLAWTASPDASGYDVYRADSATGAPAKLNASPLASPAYTDSVGDGAHHFYTVAARVGSFSSTPSSQAEGWGKIPDAVTGLSASKGTVYGAVSLAWTANPDATGYDVYRMDAQLLGTPVKLNASPLPANAYDDASASGHGVYTVVALANGVPSPASAGTEGWPMPAPVSDLSASQGAVYGAVNLAWTANPDATGYDVYRMDAQLLGTPAKLNASPLASPAYTDSVDDATHYFYTVAIAVNGASMQSSNQAEGWGKIPGAVAGLSASQGTVTGAVRLDWTGSPDATGYEIYRSSSPAAMGSAVTTIATAGYTDAIADTAEYYYTVRVVAGTARGPLGDPVAGYANLPPTAASAKLASTATSPSPEAVPAISDPNLDAGQAESFTLAVTAQPARGSVSVASKGFVYTPPADGSFSGDDTFAFTVTDKGGASVTGAGSISVSCPVPALSPLVAPSGLLPFEAGTVTADYTVYACSGALSGSLSFSQQGNVLSSNPVPGLSPGASQTAHADFAGLPGGTYDVNFTLLAGAASNAAQGRLTVATIPPPVLESNNWLPNQGDDGIVLTARPAYGNPCPLTGSDADARTDRSKCLAKFDALPDGLAVSLDEKGLPKATGYLATAGDQSVTLSVYRYGSDNAAHLVASATGVFKVRPVTPAAFDVSGNKIVQAGDTLALALKQTAGTIFCALYTDAAQAADAAKSGRACLVGLAMPGFMTQTTAAGHDAVRLGGVAAAQGTYPVAYTVSRLHADGSAQKLADAAISIWAQELPVPKLTLSNGTLIGPDRYYVQAGRPLAKATIQIPGAATKSRLTLTVNDGKSTQVFANLVSGTSFVVTLGKMALFEERPVVFHLAYTTNPGVFSENTVSAVGGTPSGIRALVKVPAKVFDTDTVAATLNMGVYSSKGLAYDAATQGPWTAYLTARDDSGKEKRVTDNVAVANGQATFNINPAGYLFMQLKAYANLVSTDPAITQTLESNNAFVQVVKGTPIMATLAANVYQAPVKTVFVVNLSMTRANAAALGAISWEESVDGGGSWVTTKANGGVWYTTNMSVPQTKQVRAHLVNRNNGVESWTDPVSLWAYPVLSLSVAGPMHTAPGIPAALAAVATYGGNPLADAVVEWTTEQPSGKQAFAGPGIQVGDAKAGSIQLLVRARLATTQADDKNAWVYARHTVYVSKPLPPRVGVAGPREVESGKPYHYTGTAVPSWGALDSALAIRSEWELPDGTAIPGGALDWTPTASDFASGKPLLFKAWVEGFQDSTTASAKFPVSGWTYVWPSWTLKAVADSNRAPANVSLQVTHDHPEMSPHLEGVQYQWHFPDGVDGSGNRSDPSRAQATIQQSGGSTLVVTISDARGNSTTLDQAFDLMDPVPYSVKLSSTPSNIWNRAPIELGIRTAITGGHPNDRITGMAWLLDGIAIPALKDKTNGVVTISQAGDHTVEVDVTSRMGKTASGSALFSLKEDMTPVCDMSTRAYGGGILVQAVCKDPDGRVVGYAWTLDGTPVANGSDHFLLTSGKSPKTGQIGLSATDDSGKTSSPVYKTVTY